MYVPFTVFPCPFPLLSRYRGPEYFTRAPTRIFGAVVVPLLLGVVLTGRFRRSVAGADGAFTFGRGFTHTLFMGFYASIWVAVGIFVYLRYFDNGAIFSDYATALSRPELQQALQESGLLEQLNAASGEGGLEGLPDALRSVGPAGYAAASLYMAMFATPLIALFAGAVCRRKGKR